MAPGPVCGQSQGALALGMGWGKQQLQLVFTSLSPTQPRICVPWLTYSQAAGRGAGFWRAWGPGEHLAGLRQRGKIDVCATGLNAGGEKEQEG